MKKTFILLSTIFMLSTLVLADNSTSGNIFFDHTTGLGDSAYNSFNMKRAYLSYSNAATKDLSYKVTYDIGSNDGGSAHTAFLKVAMVKWKTELGDVTIGMQGMNMFKTMENTWGHRFIATMPMDAYKFSASADLGIGLTRSFGPISTSVLITNGGGYKKVESDSYKKLSIHAVYGESKLNKKDGFNGGLSFSIEPYDKDSLATENTNVWGVFTGYARNGFRGGLEFDTKIQEDVSGQIFCIYATYKINDKLSILARLDQDDADTSKDSDGIQAIIAGIHYIAGKGITIAPTVRVKAPEDGDSENSIVLNFQFDF
ncbi:MAG: hypothetical protein HN829_03030 [Candidatus Marinimicrobia bacterium]|nr:hypothetical protein [Candidatus Neomarinimicrobiota bacterium]